MTDRPQRSLGERLDRWLVRSFVWGPSRQKPTPAGPVPNEPTAMTRAPLSARLVLTALAVLAPLAVATLLIPFRTTLTASAQTLVLVLPVVAVAILAHRAAAVVAAVAAALAYDVLLTAPYYSPVIDAAQDIEAAIMLGTIGTVVGTVVARELEARMTSTSRAQEISAMEAAARAAASGSRERMVDVTTRAIAELLGARSCTWSPGFHGRVGHVMSPHGSFVDWDAAALPEGTVEVPVVHAGDELGRLLVRTTGPEPVSTEERRTVSALADMLAAGLASAQ